MADDHRNGDAVASERRQNAGDAASPSVEERLRHRSIDLRHDVVTYPDRPDQCTVYPPATTGVARMSTWLTAERDDFVDLAATR